MRQSTFISFTTLVFSTFGIGCDPGAGREDPMPVPPAGTTGEAGESSEPGDSSGSTGDGDSDDSGDGEDPNAGEALAVDCTDSEHEGEDICARNSWLDDSVGFGDGPRVRGLAGFSRTLTGGFVDAAAMKLYVGVAYGFDTVTSITNGRKGAVLAVDLVTGNRELVAGELFYDDEDDPRNTDRGTHTLLNGAPGEMGHVMDVRPGPDGTAFVLTSPGSDDTVRIARVDLGTGDSTELWDNLDDSGGSGQCVVSSDDDRVLRAEPWSMEVADDGGFYLGLANNPFNTGIGLMKISADGSACEFVTRAPGTSWWEPVGANLENPSCDETSPPCIDSGYPRSIRANQGSLWFVSSLNKVIYRVDPLTGDYDRLLQHSATWPKGDGMPGVQWLAFDSEDDNVLWTIGGHADQSTAPIRVMMDIAVAQDAGYSGPLRVGGSTGPVWRHPTRPLVIVADETSLVLCESPLDSENCNNFSI